jgi:hypothetical protein
VPTRRRSAWRRQLRNSRKMQAVVTVSVSAVAVAAALVGITIADQHNQSVNQAAFGSCLRAGTPQPSGAPDVSASDGASAGPCPQQYGGGNSGHSGYGSGSSRTTTTSQSSGRRVPVSPGSFATGPIAQRQLGDVARWPVDGQGKPISLNQSPQQAVNSGNCTLVIPANPLTAKGLATPYQLADGCTEANPNEQAFVEATILAPNGQVQVYNPLVITQGSTPAAAPATPAIQPGSQVILDFGFNGTNLALTGPGAFERSSGCVDAYGQSVIGQVSACNAVNFYKMANAEIAKGTLRIPANGTATDGQPCQTTRDFALIDQDQSDNVVTEYLLMANGQTAQASAANQAALGGATPITNGSDDGLLSDFVLPANGCTGFTASDPTSPKGTTGAQALNELSARVNQKGTIAVIPTNDEMVLVGGSYNVAKDNVYRSIVDQPLLASNVNPVQVAAAYCMNMVNIAPARDQADMAADAKFASPVPTVGDNLATFMGNRLSMSFANLGCQNFGLSNPVNVTTAGNGVATAVSYNTAHQQATIPAPNNGQGHGNHWGNPWQGHGYRYGNNHGDHHKFQDPSGM